MSDKMKLDIACELLRMAIKKNAVTTTEKTMAKKWAQMSLKCSNK